MAKSFLFEILTPHGTVYEGRIVHLRLPIGCGSVGVLAYHAPYLAASEKGKLVVQEENGTIVSFETEKGFFKTERNKAVFLTPNIKKISPA